MYPKFLSAVLVLFLFVASACVPKGWSERHATQAFISPGEVELGPYLMLGSPGTVLVILREPTDVAPEVRWWTSAHSIKTTVPCEQRDGFWVAQLTNLPPDIPITYEVTHQGGTTTAEKFFAGRTFGAPFRFAAYGDTRTGHKVHQAVVMAAAKENVDFVVHSGDMVADGGIEEEWERFFNIERPIMSKAVMFPSIGNHDESSTGLYRDFFRIDDWAESERYYAKDWGNVRVVSIDPLDECRGGCSQYLYLDEVLAEGVSNNMLLVMVVHYPPYSSGAHGSDLEMREIVHSLATKYGVELVLAGHDHDYERTKLIDGVTYIVAASAGAPIRPVSPQPFSAVLRTEPHYVLIDVEQDSMTLRAINLDGETFDFVSIAPNPPTIELGP
jgi:Icc-related predicted phosphoesterase